MCHGCGSFTQLLSLLCDFWFFALFICRWVYVLCRVCWPAACLVSFSCVHASLVSPVCHVCSLPAHHVSRPLCPSDPWVLQVCVSVCVVFRLAPLLLISWFCSPVPCFPQLCPDDLVCISALYFPQFFVVISLISQLCALPVCLVPLFPSLVFCNTLVFFWQSVFWVLYPAHFTSLYDIMWLHLTTTHYPKPPVIHLDANYFLDRPGVPRHAISWQSRCLQNAITAILGNKIIYFFPSTTKQLLREHHTTNTTVSYRNTIENWPWRQPNSALV